MNRPKLKRDWIGLLVRTIRELSNGYTHIQKGTIMEVTGNHGGLRLRGKKCEHCGVGVYISRVSEYDVEIIGVKEGVSTENTR